MGINEAISVNAAQETTARPFSMAAQDFTVIAEQSKDPREIDLAASVMLGRLITLGVKAKDIDLILKAYDHALKLETSILRDKLFQRISTELFTLAGLHVSFAWALKAVKVLNDIQNPRQIPEELLEVSVVFFDFWEEEDSEEALVEFFSLWGKVCVRVSRTDMFLAAAPSMLKITGPKLLLKAMYLTLDLSFELWRISRDPRLIEHVINVTEILGGRSLGEEKLISKRNAYIESVTKKLIRTSTESSDVDLLEKALAISSWITEEDQRKIVVSRIVTQLSLLGFAEQNSLFLEKAKAIIEAPSQQTSVKAEELGVQDFVRELDSSLLKWERGSKKNSA
jgi:hypothetical protein